MTALHYIRYAEAEPNHKLIFGLQVDRTYYLSYKLNQFKLYENNKMFLFVRRPYHHHQRPPHFHHSRFQLIICVTKS